MVHLLDFEYIRSFVNNVIIALVAVRYCGQFGTGKSREGMEEEAICPFERKVSQNSVQR